MLKYLKTFYNFLMKLKQYHAVHVMILPPFIYFILLAWLLYSSRNQDYSQTETGTFIFALLILLLLGIAEISFFIALFVEIIILIRQHFTRKKIIIKWKFILNNRIYNIIFLLSLAVYFTISFIIFMDILFSSF